MDLAARTNDIVAFGGDLDYPCSGLRNLKVNVVLHWLRPNSFRDRILAGGIPTVLGNHDNPDTRALHGRSVALAGLTVGGVGGSLPVGRFPFVVDEEDYRSLLGRMGHVDVLISHHPPYGTRCDLTYEGDHAGSRAIREYIERERPLVALCGHVHESPAVDDLGGTVVVNPGPFFQGKFASVELGAEGVKAVIKDFQP